MTGLTEHLQKSEIEYIATHASGYPVTFRWDKDIEAHIKKIGFKIKRRFTVDKNQWIVTTSNISICLTDGFITK